MDTSGFIQEWNDTSGFIQEWNEDLINIRSAGLLYTNSLRHILMTVLFTFTRVCLDMDESLYNNTLRGWVIISLILGVGFIIFGDTLLTTVGVVLVVIGLISLIPVVKNSLGSGY
ncbi:MAG: hypothetical protein ABEI86_11660 [Halobacteriaceae archaeon]